MASIESAAAVQNEGFGVCVVVFDEEIDLADKFLDAGERAENRVVVPGRT